MHSWITFFLVLLQELQFQEQQEELRRELQQRSTQQLLEQSSYDNSNSKNANLDFYRRSYDKPQLITNLNNLNCQTSSNYNTINQSSATDILYELKQYESFTNNPNNQLEQFNFNNHATDRHANNYSGTNFSQNILNYNNSFYKINNINNYNYIKNQSTSLSTTHFERGHQQQQQYQYYNKQNEKYLLHNKMEREETVVESSHLVNSNRDGNGQNVAIHKFTSNNFATHPATSSAHSNIVEECEEQHNTSPQTIHRSQHFTQVSFTLIIKTILQWFSQWGLQRGEILTRKIILRANDNSFKVVLIVHKVRH